MMITITGRCPVCGSITHISCKKTAWRAYEAGALAQEAFADMDITTRETIISGMCEPCQETFFSDEE